MIFAILVVTICSELILVVLILTVEHKLNTIMSQLSDLAGTLTAATTKLQAIDDKVKTLVAAQNNSNVALDAPTQAALDALVAEVGTVAVDSGVDTPTPPATPPAA